jgi:hypothetical protein
MKPENEAVAMTPKQTIGGKSMLGKLTFRQRRVHAVSVGVLLSAVMLCATPVFAQELRHVAEVLKQTSSGPLNFGPVSAVPPLCSATTGGPGCKFLSTNFAGNGKIVEGGDDGDDTGSRFTWIQEYTGLLVFTPSGAHDANGDPTGFCNAFFEPEHWVFEDGSTIDLNKQGTVCCAASACFGGFRVANPLHVTHVSTIITGGTGRFVGLKGGGERAGSGPGAIIEEQVWELPQVPEN